MPGPMSKTGTIPVKPGLVSLLISYKESLKLDVDDLNFQGPQSLVCPRAPKTANPALQRPQ